MGAAHLEGRSSGSWNDAVGVAGLVKSLLFVGEVELPVTVEVSIAA